MTIEELLKELGIDKTPEKVKDNEYVIKLDDSKELGQIYTKLDNSTLLNEVDESSTITLIGVNIDFLNDDFYLSLVSDFEADDYRLVIKEIQK